MISYVIYDVLALTYLYKPILGPWSHAKLRATSIRDFLHDEPINPIDLYLDYDHGDEAQADYEIQAVEDQNGESNEMEEEPLIISISENEDFNGGFPLKR